MLADVVAILRCGRRAAVACLLSMRRTLDRDEYKHYLSRLYLDDYCVWLQTARFGSARLLRVWAALADTPGWDGRNGATASAPCWTSQASLPRTGRARPTSAGRSRFLRPRLGQRPTTTTPTRSRQACKACKETKTKTSELFIQAGTRHGVASRLVVFTDGPRSLRPPGWSRR